MKSALPTTRRAPSYSGVLLGALLFVPVANHLRAGALERAGSAVQGDERSPARSRRDHNDDDDTDSFLGAILTGLFDAIASRAGDCHCDDDVHYELNPQRLGEPYPVVPAAFTAYPYENGHPGNMTDYANLPVRMRTNCKRVWLEDGTDYDDIDLVSTGLVWESASRWGFDATWRTYFENLSPAGRDDLTIGDMGAFFRLLQSTNASLRVGVAMPWVAYDGDLDAGLSFTLGSEYFPVRPWILSSEVDLGRVGAATLVHVRATFGFQIRHAELYTGIDHLSLEGHDLTAMLFGVRGWW